MFELFLNTSERVRWFFFGACVFLSTQSLQNMVVGAATAFNLEGVMSAPYFFISFWKEWQVPRDSCWVVYSCTLAASFACGFIGCNVVAKIKDVFKGLALTREDAFRSRGPSPYILGQTVDLYEVFSGTSESVRWFVRWFFFGASLFVFSWALQNMGGTAAFEVNEVVRANSFSSWLSKEWRVPSEVCWIMYSCILTFGFIGFLVAAARLAEKIKDAFTGIAASQLDRPAAAEQTDRNVELLEVKHTFIDVKGTRSEACSEEPKSPGLPLEESRSEETSKSPSKSQKCSAKLKKKGKKQKIDAKPSKAQTCAETPDAEVANDKEITIEEARVTEGQMTSGDSAQSTKGIANAGFEVHDKDCSPEVGLEDMLCSSRPSGPVSEAVKTNSSSEPRGSEVVKSKCSSEPRGPEVVKSNNTSMSSDDMEVACAHDTNVKHWSQLGSQPKQSQKKGTSSSMEGPGTQRKTKTISMERPGTQRNTKTSNGVQGPRTTQNAEPIPCLDPMNADIQPGIAPLPGRAVPALKESLGAHASASQVLVVDVDDVSLTYTRVAEARVPAPSSSSAQTKKGKKLKNSDGSMPCAQTTSCNGPSRSQTSGRPADVKDLTCSKVAPGEACVAESHILQTSLSEDEMQPERQPLWQHQQQQENKQKQQEKVQEKRQEEGGMQPERQNQQEQETNSKSVSKRKRKQEKVQTQNQLQQQSPAPLGQQQQLQQPVQHLNLEEHLPIELHEHMQQQRKQQQMPTQSHRHTHRQIYQAQEQERSAPLQQNHQQQYQDHNQNHKERNEPLQAVYHQFQKEPQQLQRRTLPRLQQMPYTNEQHGWMEFLELHRVALSELHRVGQQIEKDQTEADVDTSSELISSPEQWYDKNTPQDLSTRAQLRMKHSELEDERERRTRAQVRMKHSELEDEMERRMPVLKTIIESGEDEQEPQPEQEPEAPEPNRQPRPWVELESQTQEADRQPQLRHSRKPPKIKNAKLVVSTVQQNKQTMSKDEERKRSQKPPDFKNANMVLSTVQQATQTISKDEERKRTQEDILKVTQKLQQAVADSPSNSVGPLDYVPYPRDSFEQELGQLIADGVVQVLLDASSTENHFQRFLDELEGAEPLPREPIYAMPDGILLEPMPLTEYLLPEWAAPQLSIGLDTPSNQQTGSMTFPRGCVTASMVGRNPRPKKERKKKSPEEASSSSTTPMRHPLNAASRPFMPNAAGHPQTGEAQEPRQAQGIPHQSAWNNSFF